MTAGAAPSKPSPDYAGRVAFALGHIDEMFAGTKADALAALDALVAQRDEERQESKTLRNEIQRLRTGSEIPALRQMVDAQVELIRAAEARVAELEAVLREDAQAWEADSDGWARVRRYFESLPDVDLWDSKELVAAIEGRVEAISERRATLAAAAGEPEAATEKTP